MLPSPITRVRRFIRGVFIHFPCRHRHSNLLHPLPPTRLAMTLTDQDQHDSEAGQPPRISTPRRSNLTVEDLRLGSFRSYRTYQGCPRKMHDPQASVLKKMAKNAVDVPTLIAAGCSKTSKPTCSLISPKDQRNVPLRRVSTIIRVSHASTTRTVTP